MRYRSKHQGLYHHQRRFQLCVQYVDMPQYQDEVLKSALAGKWYTDNPVKLQSELEGYLNKAEQKSLDDVIAQQSENVDDSELNAEQLKPEILVNGQKMELSAAEEITLRCGKSSITLTKSGKILIKGEHLLNRTSGSYKIRSGSIQLN